MPAHRENYDAPEHEDSPNGDIQAEANESEVIAVNEGQWRDWTSTWRKAGTGTNTRHVTMTGTITRGKKRGQSVDVELDLTDHEIMQMTMSRERLTSSNSTPARHASYHTNDEPAKSCCNSGPHVIILGLICFPFVLIGSLLISFYFGTLTWHNIFNHFYEERTICHRITLCPLLVLLFPILIFVFTIPIAIYAAFIQISWCFDDWKAEVVSFEKGFYGWLCSKLSLEFCSPYTVVTLTESESPVFQDSPDFSRIGDEHNQHTERSYQHQVSVHNARSLPADNTRSTQESMM
uniref:Transmembrane protein 169-like n=1 Tax=Phallusia mammillata TaxID=59560 RepID=A0A6F9DV47_9ASCI|nr:transmembrane protein 169-like [Phallusia mammillata]